MYDTRALADHLVTNEVQLLIFIAAWCHPTPNYQVVNETKETRETHNYWVDRLFPVVLSKKQNQSPFYMVACNRTGTEKNILFMGGSVVLKLRPQLAFASQAGSLNG